VRDLGSSNWKDRVEALAEVYRLPAHMRKPQIHLYAFAKVWLKGITIRARAASQTDMDEYL